MSGTLVPKKFLKTLDEFAKGLPNRADVDAFKTISAPETAKFCKVSYKIAGVLLELAAELDPVRPPAGLIELFAPATIGRLVGQELLRVEPLPLDGVKPFYGSGIYALYYSGEFPAYRAITKSDCPIYVGNADPVNRKARIGREQGKGIFMVVLQSIGKTSSRPSANLDIQDFQ